MGSGSGAGGIIAQQHLFSVYVHAPPGLTGGGVRGAAARGGCLLLGLPCPSLLARPARPALPHCSASLLCLLCLLSEPSPNSTAPAPPPPPLPADDDLPALISRGAALCPQEPALPDAPPPFCARASCLSGHQCSHPPTHFR